LTNHDATVATTRALGEPLEGAVAHRPHPEHLPDQRLSVIPADHGAKVVLVRGGERVHRIRDLDRHQLDQGAVADHLDVLVGRRLHMLARGRVGDDDPIGQGEDVADIALDRLDEAVAGHLGDHELHLRVEQSASELVAGRGAHE
jgi:hypothetical protein